MPIAVKICGLSTPETMDAAIAGGASHIGLVFFPPSPRSVSFDLARKLAERVPGHVQKVGVFVEPCNALLEQAIAAGQLDIIQVHKTPPNRVAAIASHVSRPCWAAIPVKTRTDLEAAVAYRGAAERILFDAKLPDDADLPGGMGLRFDWTLLRGFAHSLPWGLAGGLTPDAVVEATRVTGATLLDVSSGVESAPGIKDVDKIAAFLKAASHL
jgi:phosphoribosylanthranilate isomerase